jgi:hypothetical protein
MKEHEVEYDCHRYSHRQFHSLLLDLSSCGWTVRLSILPQRRPPNTKPEGKIYRCEVCLDDDVYKMRQSAGVSFFDALRNCMGFINAVGQTDLKQPTK